MQGGRGRGAPLGIPQKAKSCFNGSQTCLLKLLVLPRVLCQVSCEEGEEYKRAYRAQLRALAEAEGRPGVMPELLFVYVRPGTADVLAKGPAKVRMEACREGRQNRVGLGGMAEQGRSGREGRSVEEGRRGQVWKGGQGLKGVREQGSWWRVGVKE